MIDLSDVGSIMEKVLSSHRAKGWSVWLLPMLSDLLSVDSTRSD
jgi:hypothetical protein